MNKLHAHIIMLFFLTVFSSFSFAQIGGIGRLSGKKGNFPSDKLAKGRKPSDTSFTKDEKIKLKTYPASYYRYILPANPSDTFVVDTSLRPKQRFKVNFTQKDLYFFMPFQNIGQPLNRLSTKTYQPDKWYDLVPEAKKPFFRNAQDIPLYHTPTPYSRLFYLSGNKQGQMLDSRIGVNIRPYFYVGVGYKGLSSLGYYKNGISSQESWFIHTEYFTPYKRYMLRFYIVKNHLENEEYGGITDESFFENPGKDYLDRGKIPVRLEDKSIWHSRQIWLEQTWKPMKKDSLLHITYNFDYTKAYYGYEGNEKAVFGETVDYSLPFDSTGIRNYRHHLFLNYDRKSWQLRMGAAYHRLFVRYDTLVKTKNVTITPSHYIPYFYYTASLGWEGKALKNDFQVRYETHRQQWYLKEDFGWQAGKHHINFHLLYRYEQPAWYFLIWQSRFERFNWHNDFSNTAQFSAAVSYKGQLGKLRVEQKLYNRPVYFGADSLPHQWQGGITVLSALYSRHFKWRKWGFIPEVRWQTHAANPSMDLPQWNLRGMVYYTDKWFKKHMHMQVGLTVRYFSSYYMSGFNPLTNQFFQQRHKKYGGFYLADLFFDFKVKRFRAFTALEHFNALWERFSPRYYSAPYYPYADYFLRVGIIWEFVN